MRPEIARQIMRLAYADHLTPREMAQVAEAFLLKKGSDPIEVARSIGRWYGNLFKNREKLLESLEQQIGT